MVCCSIRAHENLNTDMIFVSILCNDFAIRLIEEPFIRDTDNKDEWAI